MTNKDTLADLIEKYSEFEDFMYDSVDDLLAKFRKDLQQLQAEQPTSWQNVTDWEPPKQEADIHYCHSWIIDWVSWWRDWIYKAIKRYEELEWEPPHYSNFRTAIEQNLPKQEADIDKIVKGIIKDIDRQWSDFDICSLDVILYKHLTKHLTQKTTVPNDGEVVEIKSFLRHWYCKCGTSNAKIYPYCRWCWAKIKRID